MLTSCWSRYKAKITEQRAALCASAGQAFYNTSRFTLRDLKSRGSQQQLLADFEDYLNGFSPNVQDILENFKFRNQLSTLSKADALGTLINKFLDPEIDLSPAGIDNHAMGTVFEELVRKFNEENNEEAGEHWTPRDAVRLMANLVFLPIEGKLKSGSYLLYDYAWQPQADGCDAKEAPLKDRDHAMDPIRYMVMKLDQCCGGGLAIPGFLPVK